jgi:hypothetical protein
MQYINYARLDKISKTVKPYRGSTNRFPIGSRTHNTKVFYVEEENGERVFKICYQFKYNEIPVSKEEFIANSNSGSYQDCTYRDADAPNRYVRYNTVPRDLGIVRPDNTFEFTGGHYGQGDNIVMSTWTNGWFFRSSRHGGMVYKSRRSEGHLFHPVFKGMRVDCDTMLTTVPYQVTGRRVMRKVAKDFLKQYSDFYKISEAMMKSMSYKDFADIGVDLMKELDIPKTSWGTYDVNRNELHKVAQERLHNSPLDSAVLYCMAHNIMEFYRRVSYHGQDSTYYARQTIELPNLYDTMKRKLNAEIYRNNLEVMKPIEYVCGEKYPASEWGVTITVDGKEVQQY